MILKLRNCQIEKRVSFINTTDRCGEHYAYKIKKNPDVFELGFSNEEIKQIHGLTFEEYVRRLKTFRHIKDVIETNFEEEQFEQIILI